MIDLNKLIELADLWGGGPPHVVHSRCLNNRHRARACRICVNACPVNAISTPFLQDANAASVTLNQDTCVRCGLCVNVCPTDVFAQTELPEAKLPQTVARSASLVIELACPRKDPPDLSQVLDASMIQTPRCLAALSVPTLLEMVATGKTLWLNDSLCQGCPIGSARGTIQRAVTTANRWLQVMGHEPAVRSYLATKDKLADQPISRPVVREDRLVMSRRDLFKSLTKRAGQATAGTMTTTGTKRPRQPSPSQRGQVSPAHGDSTHGTGHRLPHHIPAQRQHLAYSLRQLSPDPSASVPTATLPIADVTISDDCTACGLCAQLCPTEAISFVSDDEYYVLNFSAALCLGTDCGLCVIGCPTQAVRFGREVTADELLSTQPRHVKAGRLAPCAQCGALTDVPDMVDETSETPVCYVCQAQANRQNQSSDSLAG